MPLSWIYSKVMDVRNDLYDRRRLGSVHLGARTISVGNLTTGGTGKTPLVGHIAKMLLDRGEKVCILTRGYGRDEPGRRVVVSDGESVIADAAAAGDEPLELARRLNGRAVVIADADRAAAGEWAKVRFGITAFILDDGFQHRCVQRDLDIVCIDATAPWGGGKVLPFGRLRENVTGLARADVVVITRLDLVDETASLRKRIAELAPDAEVFDIRNTVSSVRSLDGEDTYHLDDIGPVLAFCGLGNPEAFFEQLRRSEVPVAATRSFNDHHRYTGQEIISLQEQARTTGARGLITTAKDAVKLSGLAFEMPCYTADIDVIIDRPEEFSSLL